MGRKMRPVPPYARIVQLEEALAAADTYHCIIAHNLTDLLDGKSLAGPRLYVIHATLEGVALEQCSVTPPDELRRAVMQYLRLTGAHAMAVSPLKGHFWGCGDDIVLWTADPSDDLPYRGDLARDLHVANHIHR
jgi:hypothetical protein